MQDPLLMGRDVDWAGLRDATLENQHVVLAPIAESDREPVREIAMVPEIWQYFVSVVETREDFEKFFDDSLQQHRDGIRAVFVIREKPGGKVAGSMSFGNLSFAERRLEIGWSWLGVAFQGKGINRWAKFLLLEHAFDTLGAERVEFKTDELNIKARRGLRNIGAIEEGTLRSYNYMPGGRRRNAVFYSVLRHEWPWLRSELSTHPKIVRPFAHR